MRILISAGIKTENIRRGISKAFANSGDTIDIVNYIDDIDSIFEKGDYFDKALIIDKAITKDGEIKDEFEIRNKINEFSRLMGRRLTADKNREFVFMTEYSDIANMMSEETILINKNSNVVFKKPPYTVKFFVMLLTTSVKSLPDDIVYHPAAITPEGVNKSNGNKLAEKLDIDNSQQAQVHVAPQDLDQAMFGSNDDEVDADKHINDDLGLDTDTDHKQKEADDNSFGSADSGASFDDGDFDTSDDQSTDTSFDVSEFGAPDNQVTSDDTSDFGSDQTSNDFGTQDFGSDQTSNDFGTQDFGTQDFGSDQTSNDFDAPNEQNQGANDGDFDTSDFDTSDFDTSDNQNQVSDDFGSDQGFDNNSGFETADSNQTVDQNQENEQNDFATDDFGSDQGFDDSNLNFDDTPIEKSGDLPDYVDNTADQNSQPEEVQQLEEVQQPEVQENNFGIDQDNQVEQTEDQFNVNNGNVDFDQHAVNDLQNQNYQGNYNDQQYGDQDQQYDQSQQYNNQDQQYSEQQDNMNQQDGQNQYVDNIPGFDNQYDNSQDDPNADIPGFDNDDYANNDDQIQQMQAQQEQPDSLDEFDSSEYQDQNQQNCENPNGMNMNPNGMNMNPNGMNMNPNGMNMNPNGIGVGLGVEQNNTGKKGLFGRFKSNKQSNKVHQPIQQPVQQPVQQQPVQPNRGNINIAQIKNELRPFAERGNSIVVTGCGGCGTSFVAFNLANIIVQLGYTVLLVDFDLKGKTQSYISRTNYEALEPEGNKLISGINSTTGMNQYLTVTKTGFHLLANSLGADSVEVSEVLHKDKLNKFANVAKANHAFVIYDIPFESATTFLQDITYGCDNLVLVTDMSNWGVIKMMTYVTNITSDEMQDIIFSKAQIVFNRYRNMSAAFGKRIRTAADILQEMDNEVIELIGEDPGYHFSDMAITAIINDDPDIEKGWFEDVQYTDTAKGQQVFLNLLRNIVLHKH